MPFQKQVVFIEPVTDLRIQRLMSRILPVVADPRLSHACPDPMLAISVFFAGCQEHIAMPQIREDLGQLFDQFLVVHLADPPD